MRIKIDVDGVLRDMLSEMLNIYNSAYNLFDKKLTIDDIKDYDIKKSFVKLVKDGIDPYEYFFDFHEIKTVYYSKAFENVSESIDRLKENGHTIIIATNQPLVKSQIDTLRWLRTNHIKYDEIHFTDEKWAIDSDIIIDDNPKFLNDQREKSKVKYCVDMPYNKDSQGKRFDNFNQIVDDIILNYSE